VELYNSTQCEDAMNETSFEAIVVNGEIQLPPHIHLPDHARVTVLIPAEGRTPPRIVSPRLADPLQIGEFQMTVEELPNAGL
jgi:hypothetical protein